jgi:Cu2+-exporting ATPase
LREIALALREGMGQLLHAPPRRAQAAHRPALTRITERIATGFVAALLLAASAVFLWWRTHDPSRAFEVTLALLVISCPCALSLAVPAALAAAHGTLAKIGVLAVRPDALERLARVNDVVFDKTGTLGDGRPHLVRIDACHSVDALTAQRIAAALERATRHPLAAAFADIGDVPVTEAVRVVPGAGVEGRVEGVLWRIGTAPFATGEADDGAIWLGSAHGARARFTFQEGLRKDADTALTHLRGMGLSLHLASGDAPEPVARLASTLGISDARARLSPQDKLALAHALQRDGRVVAMVGDGLNDAPVLAGADVSIAMGDGAALAHRSADLVLSGSSLLAIPQAIALARRTRTIIRQNLAWAIGYNLLALPLAASGRVTPWLAALGAAQSGPDNRLCAGWRPRRRRR